MRQLATLVRSLRALCLLTGGVLLVVRPERAPAMVVLSLLLVVPILVGAWLGARGTALRAAIVWGLFAVVLGMIAEAFAATEPLAGGRPAAGHITYLATLAALAALISVLNARTPGGGAWALLMALLIVVFLIPWLEGAGLRRAAVGLGRLRLDQPWALFYGLLVVAGVTNYLPTRYGAAAAWLGLGLGLEYLGLTLSGRSPGERATIWTAVPWTLGAAVASADALARRTPAGSTRLEAVWLWFRDHWGVVWALRVQERFNRAAEAAKWPVRLAWQGVLTLDDEVVPETAVATLKGLLRRFALPDRIERALSDGASPLVSGGAGADD